MNPTQRKIAETCKEFIPCFVNEEMYKKFVNKIADILEEEDKKAIKFWRKHLGNDALDKYIPFNRTLFLKKCGVDTHE